MRRRLAGVVHGLVVDQAADVGDHPVGAGLDEPVLVERGDVLLDDVHLLGDDAQEGLQRIALIGVAEPIDDGNQLVEAIGIVCQAGHVRLRSP